MTPDTTTSTWNIDPAHSSADFKVKHMMISNVRGKFTGISGVLHRFEADHTKSDLEVSIDVSTVNTQDEKRDGHLKSADFFDAEKFPTMTFKSTGIEKKGRRLCRYRRPDHPRRHQARGSERRRSERAGEGSLGQHAHRPFRERQNQPQRLRPRLERAS